MHKIKLIGYITVRLGVDFINMKINFNFDHLPTITKSLIYILIPLVILILIILNINGINFYKYTFLSIQIFICLFALTFAYSDLSLYLNKINDWLTTLIISLQIWSIQTIILLLTTLFLGKDLQGLKHISIQDFFNFFIQLPLVAISEEFMKILMFLGLLKLIKLPNPYRIILSTGIASLIFGLLHINYKLISFIPISLSTTVYFVYFLHYKSIYPLIISHYITDLITLIMLTFK